MHEAAPGDSTVFHVFNNQVNEAERAVGFKASVDVVAYAEQVAASVDGKHEGVFDVVFLDDALHIHIVAHHHAIVAQLLAEHTVDGLA